MMRYLVALVAVAVLAFGGSHATASRELAGPASGLRMCGAGYVHAYLSWGEKCLRAGQFCKVGNREYLKYGFVCPSSGHLRRR